MRSKTLSRAILYLFSKAPGRISAKTVSTEVFEAVKDKYLIGEVITHQRKKFKVLSVRPSQKSTKKDSDEENRTPDKKPASYEYTIKNVESGQEKVVGGAECQRQKVLGLVKIVHYLIKIHGYRLESNKSWALSNRAVKKFKIEKFEWSEHFPETEPKFEIVIPKDVKKKPLAEHVQVG